MSDLRKIHVDSDIDPGNLGKIIAGILVALALIVIAGFGWQAGWWRIPHEAVPDSNLPQAGMPLTATKPG